MKTRLVSLGLLAAMLLTGCDGGAKSIQWYMDHEKERDAKMQECIKESNPRGTEDCRNAIDASVHGGNAIQKSPNKSW
ncbi:EexN family lipoprotein [Brenneria sp. 4F2]|nr:EexN family lipoprotein [Brenneria bubanii]